MPANNSLYATCASGLQNLLADELSQLGAQSVSTAGAGVRFSGGLEMAYKACLWSRVANRVLLPIHAGPAASPEELYELVKQVDWSEHMALTGTLAVDFFTANSTITHSQYGALKVKDAVVDQFRENTGERPNVERDTPDLRINVYLFRNKARIAIDLSGSSLHRRGYREQAGPAPVKENLAASLLMAAKWPERLERGEPFVDPLCGSGTLVIEAAMMASNMAPGLKRTHFGFTGWRGHDETIWNKVYQDAQQAVRECPCDISGADKDSRSVELAIENAALAGVQDAVSFTRADVLTDELKVNIAQGLVLTNPPYGERLEIDSSFYHNLGSALSGSYDGWHVALYTADSAPVRQTRLPLKATLAARNGPIECSLYEGTIPKASAKGSASVWGAAKSVAKPETTNAAVETSQLDPFANRLKKNLKHLKSWLKREQVSAWRVYDADLPEFSVAIDIYDCDERHVVVQEYQAPATVNTAMASARLKALLQVIPETLDVNADHVHLKVREKQSGLAQYEKQSRSGITGLVHELNYVLECNFSDYLDTGLFLDHRKVREYIKVNAASKRFLNLFSYTGSATIAAATGGATRTVSVDLSNRYSQWLTRNLRLNRLDETNNQVVKSDVTQWLSEHKDQRFDLILLDPPTFSNSTGIDADWNVQRDHAACIRACMAMLEPDGVLVFSNNYRRFKLDHELGEVVLPKKARQKGAGATDVNAEASSTDTQYNIEDRSHWSIDQDFQRNARIHQCWFIRHK
ncbi:UNVERIFIED_CONTAM: hypothetical protein GTU68_018267 [Idotea baltica]|nr:hypothetical protein [Idotea baltica]